MGKGKFENMLNKYEIADNPFDWEKKARMVELY